MFNKTKVESLLIFILITFVLIWSNQSPVMSILIGLIMGIISLFKTDKFDKNIRTLFF